MAPWAWEESRVWAEPGRPPSALLRSRPGQSGTSHVMPTCVHERSPRTASSSETRLPEDP